MWNKEDFLKTTEPPYARGVIARGKRDAPQLERIQQPPRKETARTAQEAQQVADIPGNMSSIPFGTNRLAGLRLLETYLSSQLVQVRKEIEKEQQKEVEQ